MHLCFQTLNVQFQFFVHFFSKKKERRIKKHNDNKVRILDIKNMLLFLITFKTLHKNVTNFRKR